MIHIRVPETWKDFKMVNAERVISLFSGAMGLDLGLQRAGLKIAVGQDYENACVDTMKANGHNVISGDIRDIGGEQLLAAADLQPGEAFLLCGGPPCQPFSMAGKRLGINDPRGSLFMDFARMVGETRPRFFIMENVRGLTSARVDDNTTAIDVVLDEFGKLGYRTVHGVLDAVNYGVPQFRERLIIIGSRDAEDIFLPIPTHFQMHQNPDYRWRTLHDAIADLELEPGDCAKFSPERSRLLEFVPEGGNWRNLPTDEVEKAMGGAYASGGGKVGFYRRLSYREPSPTVITSPVQKSSMLCHPKATRPLSVREYARIQQFPDDWTISGTVSQQYRQIGNAVPVGLGEALGTMLLSVANGDSCIQTKRRRGTNVHLRVMKSMEIDEVRE